MKKTEYIKLRGCLHQPDSRAGLSSVMEDSWMRVEHILEICPLVGHDRIREEITKEQYEARLNDEFYGTTGFSAVQYWKYTVSSRVYPQLTAGSRNEVLDVPESAESLMARINAIEFPPETPDPVTLGYAQEASNVQNVTVSVADIDDFGMVRFTGKAARSPADALAMADNVMSEVAPGDIGVGTNPLTAESHVIALPAGNIKVSRNADGTVLYFVADDAVQAFGIQITGI